MHSNRLRGAAREHGVNHVKAGSWPVAPYVLAKLSDYGSAVRHFEIFLFLKYNKFDLAEKKYRTSGSGVVIHAERRTEYDCC
jgi:hypothetical protein